MRALVAALALWCAATIDAQAHEVRPAYLQIDEVGPWREYLRIVNGAPVR